MGHQSVHYTTETYWFGEVRQGFRCKLAFADAEEIQSCHVRLVDNTRPGSTQNDPATFIPTFRKGGLCILTLLDTGQLEAWETIDTLMEKKYQLFIPISRTPQLSTNCYNCALEIFDTYRRLPNTPIRLFIRWISKSTELATELSYRACLLQSFATLRYLKASTTLLERRVSALSE
jgi:hypothetical protein